MRKMTVAMAALGVVAGLGAAALPLSSYASEAIVPVTAVIDDALSIAITDAMTGDELGADGVLIEHVVPAAEAKSQNIAVTVGGTGEYKLTIEDRLMDTALVSAAGDRIETGTTLSGNTSAWGYNTVEALTATPEAWLAMPARNSAASLVADGATIPADGTATTYVSFGVYAAEGQEAGRYTTDVVFTATAATPAVAP